MVIEHLFCNSCVQGKIKTNPSLEQEQTVLVAKVTSKFQISKLFFLLVLQMLI